MKLSKEQLEKELFKLEQQLDIPHKDRYYNKDDKRNTPACENCLNLQSQLKERDELLRQTLDFPHNSMGESLRNDIVKMITSKNK